MEELLSSRPSTQVSRRQDGMVAPAGFDPEDVRATRARESIREVERFAYRILSGAEGSKTKEAREILRLAVGLRRKLDLWRK